MTADPVLGACWLNRIAIDPRPRKHTIVYAGAGPAGVDKKRDRAVPALNGSLHFRQIYRSVDAGETWQAISGPGFPGIPDYADVLSVVVSPSSGRFFVQEWTGQYSLASPD